MITAGLSLEQAPPISIPFRFFITAPLFLLVAGGVLMAHAPEILGSRWSPHAMAFTHLITLGVITMTMFGALSQMLPVIAGSPLPGITRIAPLVHVALSAGTLLLAWGFVSPGGGVTALALLLLGGGMTLFLGSVVLALLRVPHHTPSTIGIAVAIAAMLVTLLLGLLLGVGFAGMESLLPRQAGSALHFGWGIGGWMGLLILSVAYQVVPMFHVTPEYPAWMRRLLVPLLGVLLVLWSLLRGGGGTVGSTALSLLFLLLLLLAGGVTGYLVGRRRRKTPDRSLLLWRIGIGFLAAGVAVQLVEGLFSVGLASGELLLGVLFLFGGVISILLAMLLKIVPFLSWFHLQNRQMQVGVFSPAIPSMKELLPDRRASLLVALHLASVVLLVGALFAPSLLGVVAGAALALFGGVLMLQLGRIMVAYRKSWIAIQPQKSEEGRNG